jgi:hypothetical protein
MVVPLLNPFGRDLQGPPQDAEDDPQAYDALLDGSEGEHASDCGCRMVRSYHGSGVYLIRCPLHRSASDLRDALDLLLGVLNRDKDGDYVICQEAKDRIDAAWAALKATKGGTP